MTIGNEITQLIETNPGTGAAATAKVPGSCPVLDFFNIKNAKAVSAGAEAYRKADALVLACSEVSNDAVAPRAATAHETLLFNAKFIEAEIPSFKSRKPKVSEAVSDI